MFGFVLVNRFFISIFIILLNSFQNAVQLFKSPKRLFYSQCSNLKTFSGGEPLNSQFYWWRGGGFYSVLHAQTPSLRTPKISHHIKFIQVNKFATKLEVILIALESRGCATNLVRGVWESLRVKSPCVYCSLRDARSVNIFWSIVHHQLYQ